MTASVSSVEDVLNLALTRLGYNPPINNVMEGSRASTIALNIYAQTRDELLRQSDWGFAERNVQPALLKQAPASYVPPTVWDPALYPPLPYMFEYAYPDDCLKVRALKPVPLFIPNFDPQPNVYSIANDNAFTPSRKVILCFVPQSVLVYTGQITDPTTWEPDFVEVVAAALAKKLAAPLSRLTTAGAETEKAETVDEAQSMAVAEKAQG